MALAVDQKLLLPVAKIWSTVVVADLGPSVIGTARASTIFIYFLSVIARRFQARPPCGVSFRESVAASAYTRHQQDLGRLAQIRGAFFSSLLSSGVGLASPTIALVVKPLQSSTVILNAALLIR